MSSLTTLWRDKWARKRWIRYWLKDPFWGSLDVIAHYALRYVPINVNAAIGAGLGEIAGTYRFTTEHARVLNNLSILRPDLDDKQRREIAIAMWRHIGQAMAEYSIMDKLYAAKRITIEQDHYLKALIAQKKAIIFVSVHTGNWELCGNYVNDYGFDVLCLYKPVRNRFSRKIADKARQRMGGGLIQLVDSNAPNAMRLVCKQLAKKGAVWLAIDEAKKGQVSSPRFGRDSDLEFTNAAYAIRLAQRYNAAIVPLWSIRQPNSHFNFSIGEPFTVANTDNAAHEALLKLDLLLASWLKQNLNQWYMLHELRL
jgi:KDO2-lipid IV(A) lauroyltransferase